MKRYLLFLLLLPSGMMAQQKTIDSIKFELIKATVHFYTTDTAFNRTGIGLSECESPNYGCLKEFSKTNNLTKVDERITAWAGVKCQTADDLLKLKDRVITDLTDKKEYRKQLPGYGDYTKRLSDLMALLPNVAPQTPTTTTPKGDTLKKPDEINTGTIVPKEGNATGLLTWIALLAGLGGLGLSAWLYTRKPKQVTLTAAATGTEGAESLARSLKGVSDQVSAKADANIVAGLQQRLEALEKQVGQMAKSSQEPAVPVAAPAAKAKTDTAPAAMYAKLPDLPNGGFSNDILKQEQNGEQVYEIVVGDNTATYTVSNNSAAQGYALNDVNYILERACTLINQPFSNCRINTKEKGMLTKTVNGWMVDRKAVVEFV